MGLDFKLYEVVSHKDVEIHKEHIIEEVAYFTDTSAMLISEWFYNKDGRELHDNINERKHYITCSGDDLLNLIYILNKILIDNNMRDNLAVNYFPTTHRYSYYVSNIEILSEEYYTKLHEIYSSLTRIISGNTIDNKERLFIYNISW